MPPSSQTWTQKHGSFVLSVLMALATGVSYIVSTKTDSTQTRQIAEAAKAATERLERDGSAPSRETRQMVFGDRDKIAKVEANQDKLLEMIGNMRETAARTEQSVAYLVQVCGKQAHNNESSGNTASSFNSR